MKLNDFSAGSAGQRHHLTFQLNHARHFRDMNLQKLAEFLCFFLLHSFRKGVKVAIKHKGIIRLP